MTKNINNILNIGFIGFGLIAGSMAKAIKNAHPEYTITATSRSLSSVYDAQKDGVIDIVCENINSSFSECDFIFLCTPVVTIIDYLEQLKPVKKNGCIITDVGSVKTAIHEAAQKINMTDCFIGGHPMAGSERSGYTNSKAELMRNAKYVITPTDETTDEQLSLYRQLILDMKSIPIVMDYRTHDHVVAAISHLPHLLSAALSKVVMDNDDSNKYMHKLAAGGFKDTTRIAASSPEMWSQICSSNNDAICEMLDIYIRQLSEIKDVIAGSKKNPAAEAAYIEKLFNDAGDYRRTF